MTIKSLFGIGLFCSLLSLLSCNDAHLQQTLANYHPREGDIIFQTLESFPFVGMIKGATYSQYAHCGLVKRHDSSWIVIEAYTIVKETPLGEFIGRSSDRTIDAYRLKDVYQPKIGQLLDTVQTFLGRPYDFQFELDDKKVYCSELIYSAFKKVYGDTLGKLKTLGEMNWRPYKGTIKFITLGKVPLHRMIISPQALSEAVQLELCYKGLKSGK